MYLPASELQQYKGQFTCPYCIMDMRDEDRRIEQSVTKKPKVEILAYNERCERCGRDLEARVYIVNGKKLCKSCVDAEKNTWELVSGSPMGAGQKISVKPIIQKKKMGLLSAFISEALYALKLKRKPVEEIVVYDTKMPIQYAKPMTEKPMQKDEKKPETEGLMVIKPEVKKAKKRRKKKKGQNK